MGKYSKDQVGAGSRISPVKKWKQLIKQKMSSKIKKEMDKRNEQFLDEHNPFEILSKLENLLNLEFQVQSNVFIYPVVFENQRKHLLKQFVQVLNIYRTREPVKANKLKTMHYSYSERLLAMRNLYKVVKSGKQFSTNDYYLISILTKNNLLALGLRECGSERIDCVKLPLTGEDVQIKGSYGIPPGVPIGSPPALSSDEDDWEQIECTRKREKDLMTKVEEISVTQPAILEFQSKYLNEVLEKTTITHSDVAISSKISSTDNSQFSPVKRHTFSQKWSKELLARVSSRRPYQPVYKQDVASLETKLTVQDNADQGMPILPPAVNKVKKRTKKRQKEQLPAYTLINKKTSICKDKSANIGTQRCTLQPLDPLFKGFIPPPPPGLPPKIVPFRTPTANVYSAPPMIKKEFLKVLPEVAKFVPTKIRNMKAVEKEKRKSESMKKLVLLQDPLYREFKEEIDKLT